MQREEIVGRLTNHWHQIKKFEVKSLALFGSLARGDSQPGSDIDILVDFDGPATFDRYMDLKFFLEDLLGRSVDLVTRKALKQRVASSVERDAIYVP